MAASTRHVTLERPRPLRADRQARSASSASRPGPLTTSSPARRQEPGKKKGSTVSPATVNKDLRHLRAVLHDGERVGLPADRCREFRMEQEPKKLPTYVTGDHFAAIYAACDDGPDAGGLALSRRPTGGGRCW